MSASSAIGEAVKDYRRRSGISQDHIATITNEDLSSIRSLEAGNTFPSNPAFYPRLLQGTGIINLFVQSVLQAAEVGSSTEELEKLIDPLIEPLLGHPKVSQIFRWRVTAPEEPAQDTLTESSQIGASISEKEATNGLKEYLLPIHYPHSSVPDHASRLVQEGKTGERQNKPDQQQQAPKKGIVYQNSHATLLVQALENPDHEHRLAAEQAVRGFVEAVEKPQASSDNPDHSPQTPTKPETGILYEQGRLTTIAEASKVSGIKLGTIYNYLSDGKLTVRGRIFSSAPGGGKVLIDLDELDSVLSSRKPGGRPRIIHERLTGKRPRGRPRKTPRAEEVEPNLITLKEAVKTHGIGYETLRSWYRSGHLPERGREVFGTHGGGKILIAEKDVIRLKSQPPRRGKPPIDPI